MSAVDEVIPQDTDAEEAILGAMLWSPAAIEAAGDIGITSADFHSAQNGYIFQAILDVHEAGPVDEITIVAHLKERGRLAECGGPVRVLSLQERCPATANARAYARRVKDLAMTRRIMNAGEEIRSLAMSGLMKPSDLVLRAGELVAGMEKGSGSDSTFVTLDSVMGELYNDMEDRFKDPLCKRGLPTGFHGFDEKTGGLHAGNLIVVAGRPAMGKSAWGVNVATNVALNTGSHVAIFTLEMSDNELTARVLSDLGNVNGKRIFSGTPHADDFDQVAGAMSRIGSVAPGRIHIDSSTSLTPYRARTASRRLARDLSRRGEKLSLIVIDYLQLMQGDGRVENRNLEVSQITSSLKRLAKELDVPVLLLSQLSRRVEQRPDKRPMMSDLRDSGSIEQDANIVSFLYRPEYYGSTEIVHQGKAELIIAKNRMGETGECWMDWRPQFTRFKSIGGVT